MTGDRYQVFTSIDNFTVPDGIFDSWHDAKEARNDKFFSSNLIKSAWIMRSNPSLNLQQNRYGNTLRKDK